MRSISRRFFAASLFSLLALLPMTAQASGALTEYVVGSEYAVGSCPDGSDSGSFAGYGSATPGGRANAVFNTTICHTSLGDTNGAAAAINAGGSFTLVTGSVALAGSFGSGAVGPGLISPLYPGSFLCKEVFPVAAVLAPPTNPPTGFTSITGGSAIGKLTHIGFFTGGGTACQPLAAAITGQATLDY